MPSRQHAFLKAVADTPPPAAAWWMGQDGEIPILVDGEGHVEELGGDELPRHDHNGRRAVRLDLSTGCDVQTRPAELLAARRVRHSRSGRFEGGPPLSGMASILQGAFVGAGLFCLILVAKLTGEPKVADSAVGRLNDRPA